MRSLTILEEKVEAAPALEVTAVIATKNSEKTVGQCVESLIGEVSEVVVVDGGSTDQTISILRKYPQVKVLVEGGETFHGAYNTGFENTNTDLVMFIDSDAFIEHGFFPGALRQFENQTVGIVACTATGVVTNNVSRAMSAVWDYRRGTLAKFQENRTLSFLERQHARFFMSRNMHSGSTITGPCYIVRKKCLEEIGGFPAFGDDYVMGELVKRRGYLAVWYTTHKLFHYTRSSMDSLLREFLRFGLKCQGTSCRYFRRRERLRGLFLIPLSMCAGILAAKESRNPLPAVLVPLLRTTQFLGILVGIVFFRQNPDKARVDQL